MHLRVPSFARSEPAPVDTTLYYANSQHLSSAPSCKVSTKAAGVRNARAADRRSW